MKFYKEFTFTQDVADDMSSRFPDHKDGALGIMNTVVAHAS